MSFRARRFLEDIGRDRAALLGVGALGCVTFGVRWWRHRHDGVGEGYVNGQPVRLELVTLDGRPVERRTADAFLQMRDAARRDRISLRIVSAFRTSAEQARLHECYLTGACNEGRFAAPPGYSSHQSGAALDLAVRGPGVLSWLRSNAARFSFFETVESEPWHWEFLPNAAV